MKLRNTRRSFTQINRVGQVPGVRVDNSRAIRLGTCNLLGTARGAVSIVGQALPDNAPVKGHLAAFTLIELLVVVLIIGILAAVAVSQYQLAVAKSRFSTIKSLVENVASAEEVYYLANGKYTVDIRDLDISLPRGWSEKTNKKMVLLQEKTMHLIGENVILLQLNLLAALI